VNGRDIVAAAAGVLLVAGLWITSGFALCGLSGCGGGFGRSYAPGWVLGLLAATGLAAAGWPAAAARRSRSARLLAVAAAVLVVVPVAGGLVIGAGLDGYPVAVPQETRDRDRDRNDG